MFTAIARIGNPEGSLDSLPYSFSSSCNELTRSVPLHVRSDDTGHCRRGGGGGDAALKQVRALFSGNNALFSVAALTCLLPYKMAKFLCYHMVESVGVTSL